MSPSARAALAPAPGIVAAAPAHAPQRPQPQAHPQQAAAGEHAIATRVVLPLRPSNVRRLSKSPVPRQAAPAAAGPVPLRSESQAGSESDTRRPAATRSLSYEDAAPGPGGTVLGGAAYRDAEPHTAWLPPGSLQRVAVGPPSRASTDSLASPWARALDAGHGVGAGAARRPPALPSVFADRALEPFASSSTSGGRSVPEPPAHPGGALVKGPTPGPTHSPGPNLDAATRECSLGRSARLRVSAVTGPQGGQGGAPAAELGRLASDRAASVAASAKSMCAPVAFI